jgi:hypothetical protein
MKKKKISESHANAENLADEVAYMADPEGYNPMKLKRQPMTETEELKNADVPKPVWETRNEYLHKHNEKLSAEIKEVRRDNKRLATENDNLVDRLRKAGL